jgi:hypothetical protein
VKIYEGETQSIEATEEFLNAQWVAGMCAKLQVLQITGINWLPNEMSFIKFILRKAPLLRSLSVSHADECIMSHDGPLLELQKCTRASAEAQIVFKGKKLGFRLQNFLTHFMKVHLSLVGFGLLITSN